MMDFTKEVRTALLAVCPRVYFYYPDDFTKLPAISFYDNGNSAEDNRDLLAQVSFQADIWAKTLSECKSLAASADTAMRGLGFRRTFSQSVHDPSSGYRHQSMRYEGTYNALDNKIYSRS